MNTQAFIKALEKNLYQVSHFATAKEAAEYLDKNLDGREIGLACSATMSEMGLADRLAAHNTVYDPAKGDSDEMFLELSKKCLTAEIYLVSVNAAAETGEFVNLDATGNRLAGSLFGHKKVYFLVTANKVEPTLERAVWRARNIAGPEDAKRMGLTTPCAAKGDKCYNCSAADRICNGMAVYFRKMEGVEEAEVIIIDEALGF